MWDKCSVWVWCVSLFVVVCVVVSCVWLCVVVVWGVGCGVCVWVWVCVSVCVGVRVSGKMVNAP